MKQLSNNAKRHPVYEFKLGEPQGCLPPTNLLLIDSRRIHRESLAYTIENSLSGYRVFGYDKLDDVEECAHQPQLVTFVTCDIDVSEYSLLNGHLNAISKRFPDAYIVFVIGCKVASNILHQLISDGVSGVVFEKDSTQILLEGLRIVALGGVFFPTNIIDRSLSFRDIPEIIPTISNYETFLKENPPNKGRSLSFTKREIEIIRMIGLGMQNKIIAFDLKITESTVKVHLQHIMRKLNATNRVQVALFASKLEPIQVQDSQSVNEESSELDRRR